MSYAPAPGWKRSTISEVSAFCARAAEGFPAAIASATSTEADLRERRFDRRQIAKNASTQSGNSEPEPPDAQPPEPSTVKLPAWLTGAHAPLVQLEPVAHSSLVVHAVPQLAPEQL
jgi:hypothetical protein